MRRFSFSKVSTYLRCPRLYRHRYIERSEPEKLSLALPLGSAMHDAIQWDVAERARGRKASEKDIHKVFEELLEARVEISSCPIIGELDEAIETGRRMVDAYVLWGRIQNVSSIEGEHRILISEELELEGRIDFVRDGKSIELLELKTSARAWSQMQADLSLQAASYALLTGIPDVRYIVMTKTKAAKIQELVAHCTDWRLAQLRETIIEVDRAIEARAFPRNMSVMTCGGCEFRNLCLNSSHLGVPTPVTHSISA